jgi:hypothetical protein
MSRYDRDSGYPSVESYTADLRRERADRWGGPIAPPATAAVDDDTAERLESLDRLDWCAEQDEEAAAYSALDRLVCSGDASDEDRRVWSALRKRRMYDQHPAVTGVGRAMDWSK